MSGLIEWEGADGEGALMLDAVRTYGFETAAEVTKHPVETGTAIADHIRPLNGTLAMEGVITNAPVIVPTTQMGGVTRAPARVQLVGGSVTVLKWSGEFDRVKLCDSILAGLVGAGQLVRVTTGLRTVENLGITRYKAEKAPGGGDAVAVTLEFERVRIATTARAAVPAVRRLQIQAQRGAQPPDDRSALAHIADGGRALTEAQRRAAELRRARGGA